MSDFRHDLKISLGVYKLQALAICGIDELLKLYITIGAAAEAAAAAAAAPAADDDDGYGDDGRDNDGDGVNASNYPSLYTTRHDSSPNFSSDSPFYFLHYYPCPPFVSFPPPQATLVIPSSRTFYFSHHYLCPPFLSFPLPQATPIIPSRAFYFPYYYLCPAVLSFPSPPAAH
eukprot:1154215-Pelagomonas_calceolata.AAC.1